MKINKVILRNFSSFEGLNEFDFSIEEDKKNIILIGGKNGAGKTSLFTAIKIALYGPLAYGYIGANPHYIAKIKDCINMKAYQMDKVEAGVQLSISIAVEREMRDYEITRVWNYEGQRLLESYSIKKEGKVLDKQELSYFENYLKSLLPPDLFEFFLFDGEEVGNIFSTRAYNTYVRNAVYTLCGFDIYEIIRKYMHRYAGKATTDDEEKLVAEYEKLKTAVEEAERRKEKLLSETEEIEERLEQLEIEKTEVETAFKNAGGIGDEERKRIKQDLEACERTKAESAAKIKYFMEGLMPFYITREFTGTISMQLDKEAGNEMFQYIRQQLNREEMRRILSNSISGEKVNDLVNIILDGFKPDGFEEDAKVMYDLSKEDTARVNAMISELNRFDGDDMIHAVMKRQEAVDHIAEINKTLKNALSEEEAIQYREREYELLKQESALGEKLYMAREETAKILDQLQILNQQKEAAWQKVRSNVQNQHVYDLSSGLASMMDTLLKEKTTDVKRTLETLIVEKLQQIYRKNNLITHIEIDDAFQFKLYQDASYTADELAYLMKNLGKEEFGVLIGEKGKNILLEHYDVKNLNQLQKQFSFVLPEQFDLYKNIDLSRLSKGERQIFILSLYWAIIELSGQDIPFVADTPYARIDANHRKEISEKFFPNISKQVVILSTDEEINEEYYQILKPYIAREYLLINDENQNRTTVEKHYFFEI